LAAISVLAALIAIAVVVSASAIWMVLRSSGEDRVMDALFLTVFAALLCYALAFGASRWFVMQLERRDLEPERRAWLSLWSRRLERLYRGLLLLVAAGALMSVLASIL
jgi:hypothetical protein